MKKKIKDLTKEECNKICAFHSKKGTSCLNDYAQNIKCPLHYKNTCLRGFIEKLQYVEREVEINENNKNQTPGKTYKIKIISKRDGSILDTLICDYNEDVPLAEDMIIANYCQTHGIHRLDILLEKEY